jgi:CBS domain-containing protein
MKVADICQTDVVTVHPEILVSEAARRMTAEAVGCVVVVQEGVVLGILTDRDIVVRGVRPGLDLRKVAVTELMSRGAVTIGPDADTATAITLMAARGVRRLPVVDGDGTVIGLLSLDDVAAVVGDQVAALRAAITATLAR